MIDAIRQVLPEGVRVVLLADRDFVSVDLMGRYECLYWRFSGVLKGLLITSPMGKRFKMGKISMVCKNI